MGEKSTNTQPKTDVTRTRKIGRQRPIFIGRQKSAVFIGRFHVTRTKIFWWTFWL